MYSYQRLTTLPSAQLVIQASLAEVAELDTLLGFKGNYMIFPMRNSNVLTDFMMAPYVDSESDKLPNAYKSSFGPRCCTSEILFIMPFLIPFARSVSRNIVCPWRSIKT